MHLRGVSRVLVHLCWLMAALMAAMALLALVEGGSETGAFLWSAGVCVAVAVGMGPLAGAWSRRRGGPGGRPGQGSPEPAGDGAEAAEALGWREAFLAVALAWVLAGLLGALPFFFSGVLPSPADAFFEAVSGFTTTGATVMVTVEAAPDTVLLWRSALQWLGGMGIVVLFVSLAPRLGAGGVWLFRAEFPNPAREQLLPRVASTARRLWLLYLALTAAAVLGYLAAGLSLFDAVNHAFTSLSTGGFSTRTAGVWERPAAEWVAAAAMFLGSTSFVLQYRLWWMRDWQALRQAPEFWAYAAITAAASLVAAGSLWFGGTYDSALTALRKATFHVVSILSTTGYASADYGAWPPLAAAVIWAAMFTGGMTGSTSGGPKVFRWLVMAQHVGAELLRLVHPRSVHPLRLGGVTLPEGLVGSVGAFLFCYALLWAGGTLVLAAAGLDALEAASGTIACLGNIGPGFGRVGPVGHYADLAAPAKLVLAALMIAGRLEVFGVAVLLHPAFWRRR